MEENSESAISLHCWGCLCSSKELKIQDYKIQYAHFMAIFERDTITLCFLCKRIAQHAELFIKNALNNKIILLLEKSLGDLSATIQKSRTQLHLPSTLTCTHTTNIINRVNTTDSFKPGSTLHGNVLICNERYVNPSNAQLNMSEISVTSVEDARVRCEDIKIERHEDVVMDHFEEEFFDVKELINPLKEEVDVPKKESVKKEMDIGSVNVIKPTSTHESPSQKTVVKQEKPTLINKKNLRMNKEMLGIETIHLTVEQCMEEREQLALDEKYLNHAYKCVDCLKGFKFKATYEAHLEKHTAAMGAYECDICKIRMHTEHKLEVHKKNHVTRYKCGECGIIRVTSWTLKNHYTTYHQKDEGRYVCPHCGKDFKCKQSQEKHTRYAHFEQGGVTCAYCNSTLASKTSLRTHLLIMHQEQQSANVTAKRYACQQCGMSFKSSANLKRHSTKHLVPGNTYCVECDKTFKTTYAFEHHLKTTRPHVSYSQLPFTCQQCFKKFAYQKNLDRHVATHSEIRPFKCDKCEKAYGDVHALRSHTRHTHDGHTRPRRHACHACDKRFYSKAILETHIRTHTGERPYQCDVCSARFAQLSAFNMHKKLVHQRKGGGGRGEGRKEREEMKMR